MKTIKNIAMIATATVAMMAASTSNSFAAPTPEPSIANEIMHTPRVMQYYRSNSEQATRRFEYTVDEQGRVTNKVMFGWDKETATWTPICQYHANYGDNTHQLTYGVWDTESQSFSRNLSSQLFDASKFTNIISLPEHSF